MAPPMPSAIRALLYQDYDPEDVKILDQFKMGATVEFAHGRGTFHSHLEGTYGILHAWGQPRAVCRAGMTHSVYSGDLFQFFLWDAARQQDRETLQSMIGSEAEGLTYLFGTINRAELGGLEKAMDADQSMAPLSQSTIPVKSRLEGTTTISPEEAANILIITVADYLDQMVDTNGWRDHHQVEMMDCLYPGDGRPAVALHWFSKVCRAIRSNLAVIPPVFNHCTAVLSKQDEVQARDAYWYVTLHETSLSMEEQIAHLEKAVRLNPFVGEPHLLLAQLYIRQQKYALAVREGRKALTKMYALASAWDKRRTYAQWVGFARMTLLRASRLEQCLPHLPITPEAHGLVSLHQVVAELRVDAEE
ncbi:unknown protein [Seminavis robusta]|uniref:DUF6817 domain-containing protein n=1 Tax=Seminavis robusta TaxID=568900 RepID=A0A9N8EM93_9STRA|nr:unknown protein [Seminavis robusta]|eukprot:Sro1530_g280090.1 n/a (362) ;mRNA; r:13002-14087